MCVLRRHHLRVLLPKVEQDVALVACVLGGLASVCVGGVRGLLLRGGDELIYGCVLQNDTRTSQPTRLEFPRRKLLNSRIFKEM